MLTLALILLSSVCYSNAALTKLSNGAVLATVVRPDPVLSRSNPLHSQKQNDLRVPDGQNRNVISKTRRWANNTVPYDVSRASPAAIKAIQGAIKDLNDLTCVRWIPKRATDKFWVKFIVDDGCYSYQGNINRAGGQEISLGRGCEYNAIAMHEMMHAMGHIHEHQRVDRDKYITVYLANVDQDMQNNFALSNGVDEEMGDVQGGAYCYNSIMHYTGDSFSNNGKPSMVSKLSGVTLGQTTKHGMTDYDVDQIKKYYECK